MHHRLLFVKVVIASLLYFCGCYRTNEQRAEYLDVDNYTDFKKNEGLLRTLMQEQPVAFVVELRGPLLETLKKLWSEENITSFPVEKILLGAFDSKGLQHRSVYDSTPKFLQAVQDLKPSANDVRNLNPTMHVLNKFLHESLSEGSVVLMTMTQPSDEDYAQVLEDSLTRRKCQLSVLWRGETTGNDYSRLKALTEKTGGKFGFLTGETISEVEVPETQMYQELENFENVSGRLRFPEQEKETSEDTPLASRASDQKHWEKISIPLIIEVASGTSLEIRPGGRTQIPFTVKNNLNLPIQVTFNAKFNGVIQQVQPQRTTLEPSAVATVIVSVVPLGIAQSNAVGTVTLLANVLNRIIARSAVLSMTPQTITDNTNPKLTYKYEGDCSNYREPQNCENGQWGLRATIVDEESGLLKILSEPYGLLFESEFISGTKSPVTVFYSATCCQPTVHIWAEDLRGNYVKKSFDVFNQNLRAGEIAGIVLGVLLLLFLIVGIIIAVVLYKRRNRRNMIIPRARTGSR